MIVGASPAPIAVRILVLNASFWNPVRVSVVSGLASLKASTESVRIPSCGCPVRIQMVASPEVLSPGPDEPHAVSAPITTGVLIARVRNDLRDVCCCSMVISCDLPWVRSHRHAVPGLFRDPRRNCSGPAVPSTVSDRGRLVNSAARTGSMLHVYGQKLFRVYAEQHDRRDRRGRVDGDRWSIPGHVGPGGARGRGVESHCLQGDRKSTRLNSRHVAI